MSDKIIRKTLDADLWLEPTITDTGRGILLELAVERVKKTGAREYTKLKIKLPRESVNRILYEVRKLHDKERTQISDDIGALTRANPCARLSPRTASDTRPTGEPSARGSSSAPGTNAKTARCRTTPTATTTQTSGRATTCRRKPGPRATARKSPASCSPLPTSTTRPRIAPTRTCARGASAATSAMTPSTTNKRQARPAATEKP